MKNYRFYRRIFLFVGLLCFFSISAQTQFGITQNQKSTTVPFQLINNLIVIPVEVNGTSLSFILDTGVSKPILFNLNDKDSIQINDITPISIRGLGSDKPVEALKSFNNTFELKGLYNPSQELYVVLDESINFSARLGMTIHGIIGYDLFKDFIVEVNYSRKRLKFHNRETYKSKKCRKCEEIPLTLFKNKPYVDTKVVIENSEEVPAHLLVDTGSSDAVWLFKDKGKNINVPQKKYTDFLGKGLGGSIYGERAKLTYLNLAGSKLHGAKVAFPDSATTTLMRTNIKRNGSVGGEVLKRFNLVYDYQGGTLTLRKNGLFNKPFQYNMSGIEIEYRGSRLIQEITSALARAPQRSDKGSEGITVHFRDVLRLNQVPNFKVVDLRKGSPADFAGLQEGDIILKVNNRSTHQYNLQEVTNMLQGKAGKKVRLLVERNGVKLRFDLVLKSLI
ncbi:PDZ domain-containing protein [Spongiivirga citrea]|uniref:PDZ domain-containing protein n=1 Tax=Spongiivirga citrea TaxID=1481457 RepID=A0A6M0CKI7_9FLAO|nr:PDZ domain-containing protein [Spongiivirga citrea]NER18391.1 PDZ domain-containing protein [Spongiivirga citrea]